jgi:hypothetical protein
MFVTKNVALLSNGTSGSAHNEQNAGSVSGYTGDRGRSGAAGARVLCVGLRTVDLVDGTLQHRLDVEPFPLG